MVDNPKSREPLSRGRVVTTAVALADAEGLGRLTMRRLGQALGVEAMSLYHHVANKDDLLDGMVDAVFAEIDLPDEGDAWRPAMRARAGSLRTAMRAHPWAISLMDSRSSPGPNTLAHHDAVLGCLRRAGFEVADAAHAFSLLDSYVYGFCLQEAAIPATSGDDVVELAGSIFDGHGEDTYPHLAELTREHVTRGGYDYADEFAIGLDLVLDALESLAP